MSHSAYTIVQAGMVFHQCYFQEVLILLKVSGLCGEHERVVSLHKGR